MYLPTLSGVLALSTLSPIIVSAYASTPETVTGPVDFLWPEQRPWYALYQNEGPCGTNATVGNRTSFPLTSGAVSLSIAEDAYSVVFRIAYLNNPSTSADFTNEIVHMVSEVEAGHQCYSAPETPFSVMSGTNATIQLEYTSQYEGSESEVFYACADITLMDVTLFSTNIPCFNVTVTDPTTSGIASPGSASTSGSTASPTIGGTTIHGSSGLSSGAKAGIAVAFIIAGLAVIGGLALAILRKRGGHKNDAESGAKPGMKQIDSTSSFTTTESKH